MYSTLLVSFISTAKSLLFVVNLDLPYSVVPCFQKLCFYIMSLNCAQLDNKSDAVEFHASLYSFLILARLECRFSLPGRGIRFMHVLKYYFYSAIHLHIWYASYAHKIFKQATSVKLATAAKPLIWMSSNTQLLNEVERSIVICKWRVSFMWRTDQYLLAPQSKLRP